MCQIKTAKKTWSALSERLSKKQPTTAESVMAHAYWCWFVVSNVRLAKVPVLRDSQSLLLLLNKHARFVRLVHKWTVSSAKNDWVINSWLAGRNLPSWNFLQNPAEVVSSCQPFPLCREAPKVCFCSFSLLVFGHCLEQLHLRNVTWSKQCVKWKWYKSYCWKNPSTFQNKTLFR